MKRDRTVTINWAWRKMREWLKKNCLDIDTNSLGNMKYCLEKYFETLKRKKPNKKSTLILLSEYRNKNSPIYKGVTTPGLKLKRDSRKDRRKEYMDYLKSEKWWRFKKGIIQIRGETCENCRAKTKSLDLHHKTYARLFNEHPQDVVLLCRKCHKQVHL